MNAPGCGVRRSRSLQRRVYFAFVIAFGNRRRSKLGAHPPLEGEGRRVRRSEAKTNEPGWGEPWEICSYVSLSPHPARLRCASLASAHSRCSASAFLVTKDGGRRPPMPPPPGEGGSSRQDHGAQRKMSALSDLRVLAHSGLMPASRTTLPHFSVSSAMNLPKSAGEPENTAQPRSVSRSRVLASASAALISLLSFSTISAGVPLGATIPYQP